MTNENVTEEECKQVGGGMKKTIDENFKDWEKSFLGFGYGSGEEHVIGAIKEFMNVYERPYDYRVFEDKLGPVVTWLLINALCAADIIEYGTSPRYGWLTKKGENLKSYMDKKTLDELLDVIFSGDEMYIYCCQSHCNCEPEKEKCENPFWVS